MTKYETVAVFDGSLPQDAIEKERQKVEDLLSANGKIVKIDEWGKKYLAYPIKKKTSGFYVLFLYEYEGNAGKFIDANFRFNDKIIRHLTVTHQDVSIFAASKTPSERVVGELDNSSAGANEEEGEE